MGLTDIIRVVADALGSSKPQIVEDQEEGGLLGSLANAMGGSAPDQAADPRIRPASEDPLGDPADQIFGQDVLPASQDPYGDPADQLAGAEVLPASMDPLGDPGGPLYGQNIRPASEDPLGDPADQQNR